MSAAHAPGAGGAAARAWARGEGVALWRHDPPGDGDGIERGSDATLLDPPPGVQRVQWYDVRAGGAHVGLLAIARDTPRPGAATVRAVAIDPAHRGHAYGTRALQAAEPPLRREGAAALYARVPRTNGRGLYFMLRAGYAPLAAPPVDDGATWFLRADG